MTAMTFRKSIGAVCCLLGIVLGFLGAYWLWSTPIELGKEAVVLILSGFVFHVIFWILWP